MHFTPNLMYLVFFNYTDLSMSDKSNLILEFWKLEQNLKSFCANQTLSEPIRSHFKISLVESDELYIRYLWTDENITIPF